ncbi:MAG: hydrogenase formation protein HypD [Bacteroidetes bacterium]|nr:hydrogenase formation protein HypD [Bacteroidota bacterium]
MKYVDEYRDRELIETVSQEIKKISKKNISVMEVCGGHTMAIHRFALNTMLPDTIRLLSGPGCPVCVSSQSFIDTAVEYSKISGMIIATYGDLIRVPGSHSSLEKEKSNGSDIRIIYSVLEGLEIARANPERTVIFPGIGFETTSPATAATVIKAKRENISNFFVLSAHKIMPPVMKALVEDGVRLNGFIAPGHVSAITGSVIYNDLASRYGLSVVISGFEPLDIMQSILMLVRQIEAAHPQVEIQYKRVVNKEGNKIAQELVNHVFRTCNDDWRGLGMITSSGLSLCDEFAEFNPKRHFRINVPETIEPKGCICGNILRGMKTPPDCKNFAKECTPMNPMGACMVSSEGTCATYYKYRN